MLAATDPAQPYGAALPWPKRDERGTRPRRSASPAPTSSSPAPSRCSTSSAAARACRCSSTRDDAARSRPALEALAAFVTGGRGRKLSLERVDGEPVVGSPLEALLVELGFRAGPAQAHAERVIARLDHVQVAAPAGGEGAARAFYGELLGLPELPKPERLRARGGVWFAVGDQQLHVGIEEPFAPARKAHPALAVPRASDLQRARRAPGGRRPRRSPGTARASTSRTRSATASSCSRPTPSCACARCATTSAPGRARSSRDSWGDDRHRRRARAPPGRAARARRRGRRRARRPGHLPDRGRRRASSSRSTRSPSAAASAARWSRRWPTPPARRAARACT